MFYSNPKSISMRIALAIVLIVGIFGVAPAHASAAILYVKQNTSGANNGTSWANAYTDLQSALAVASSGDEVWVAAGTYKPGNIRDATFSPKNGVAMYGGFDGTETARD